MKSNQTTKLRNDRDAILAIVAEHYIFDDKHLRKAKILGINDSSREVGLSPIEHNSNWLFAYDMNKNIIYWKAF